MSSSNTTDNTTNELIFLQYSWEEFADIGIEIYKYRETLKRLRKSDKQETHEEFEKRKWLLAKTENSLKNQFLYRILDDEFLLFGIDVTHQLNNKVIELPSFIFDPRTDGFKIDWDKNSLITQGFQIAQIQLKPNWPMISNLWACEAKPNLPVENNSASVASKPNLTKQGRPSSGEQITKAIRHYHKENKAWFDLTPTERRIQYFKYIKDAFQKDPKISKGFSSKTIEKYEKIFKENL